MNAHTPLPWSNDPLQPTIWANDGDTKVATIADLPWVNGKSDWMTEQANAALIVHAVNNRDKLVEMLAEAERVIRFASQESTGRVKSELVGGWLHHADKIRAALAAEGEAK